MSAVQPRLLTWSSGAPALIEHAHHFDVAEMRGGDESGAVVAARDVGRAIAELERGFERGGIVGDRGDRDHVVAVRVERVGIGARVDQRASSRRAAS